jgi:hypothetical protein
LTARPESRRALRTAGELFANGRFEDAETLYRQVGAGEPDDFTVAVHLGHLALFADRLAEAERWLRRALEHQPGSLALHAQLADTLYRRRAFAEAALHYRTLGRTAMADKLDAVAPLGPYELRTPGDAAQVPWLGREPLPVLRARVNGREANLALDTGVGELALDPGFARAAAIRLGGSEQAGFAGGRRADISHGWVEELALGGWRLGHVPVQVYEIESLFAPFFPGLPVQGILGTAVFYRFRTTLDYPAGRLVLHERSSSGSVPLADRPPPACLATFWLAGDHYVLTQARMGGSHPFLVCIDTGMTGAALAAPLSTLQVAGLSPPDGRPETGYGGAGPVDTLPFRVPELRVGRAVQHEVGGQLLARFPLQRELGFHVGGLLAHDFFRPYAMTLDFQRMQLCLQPGP